MLEFIPWVLSPETMYQKIRTGHNQLPARSLPLLAQYFYFYFQFPVFISFTLFAIDSILHDECFFLFVIRFR
jgi:hypothetical protein